MNPVVGILGRGAVGSALADRLSACSRNVYSSDQFDRQKVFEQEPPLLFLALTRGSECEAQLAELTWIPETIVDLTTQNPESADRCARVAFDRGSAYHGGGLTGGGRELSVGRAVLLLGDEPGPGGAVADVLEDLGRVIGFPSARVAAQAKLLHNFVLLTQQWAAGLALRELGPEQAATLVKVLASGTTGRPVDQWSIVRDAVEGPSSTYLCRLASKDLDEMALGLPVLAGDARPVIDLLAASLRATPETPFTQAFLTRTDRALAGPLEE